MSAVAAKPPAAPPGVPAAKGSGIEERRKARELLEARKAGTVAPEQDEEGKDINPHIPLYIAQRPWYLTTEESNKPGLKHQRAVDTTDSFDRTWYPRGARIQTATKFRKGACENCGALTHKTKECTERPRAKGARWTNKNIAPDEVVVDLKLDFEGKRDRWNGYDPNTHELLVQQHEKIEMEKRKKKAAELADNFRTEPDAAHDRYPNSVEEKPKDDKSLVDNADGAEVPAAEGEKAAGDEDYLETEGYNNAPIAKLDPRTRTTIRNLRIREDTAKYLRNLDPNSAHYDPKSRSMRENPTPHINPDVNAFVGDNFVRQSGDVTKVAEMNAFAWDAYERGQEVHLQAMPSQAELLHKQFKERKEQLQKTQKAELLAKYGGAEHLPPSKAGEGEASPAEAILPTATETYVEYNATGRVIKGPGAGAKLAMPKSKYEEDVFLHNHTSVWGSYWDAGQWGYACCHATTKAAYCTGQAGIEARKSVLKQTLQNTERLQQKEEEKEKEKERTEAEKIADLQKKMSAAPKHGREKLPYEKEAQPNLDETKVREAMAKLQSGQADESAASVGGKRQRYNSASASHEVSAEEMEAYKRTRLLRDDPMAQMKKKGRDDDD